MFRHPALIFAALGFSIATVPLTASAKDIVVHMKNKGYEGSMVFEPSFITAAPGDIIHFMPTDAAHNAETIPAMLPAGATPIKGKMSQEVTLTVTKPGLYGIECLPHYSMGMVALIQVGKVGPADLAAARSVKLPPFAAKRMSIMLARVR